jgi:Fur family ferric uptake transcriptional regulator
LLAVFASNSANQIRRLGQEIDFFRFAPCYNQPVNKTDKTRTDLLHNAGLRRTPIRLEVLKILTHDGQPLSAPQILQRFADSVDKVTLYRTLHTLTQKKLLHQVRGDDQIWRYGVGDPKGTARHEHAHFVCDECGTVECLADTPAPNQLAKRSGVRPGYRVEYSEVLVHGTCPDCRR